jgi:hypothetical protein
MLQAILSKLKGYKDATKLYIDTQSIRNSIFKSTGEYPEMTLEVNGELCIFWPKGSKFPKNPEPQEATEKERLIPDQEKMQSFEPVQREAQAYADKEGKPAYVVIEEDGTFRAIFSPEGMERRALYTAYPAERLWPPSK